MSSREKFLKLYPTAQVRYNTRLNVWFVESVGDNIYQMFVSGDTKWKAWDNAWEFVSCAILNKFES